MSRFAEPTSTHLRRHVSRLRRGVSWLGALLDSPVRGLGPHVLLLAGMAFLAWRKLAPLGAHLDSDVLSGPWPYDGWLNVFTLDWNVGWLTRAPDAAGRLLFDAPVFHPHHGASTFTEPLLGQTLLALLIRPFTTNPITAHNVILVAEIAFAAYATALLVAELSHSVVLGVALGCAVVYSPAVFVDLPRIQSMAFGFTPLALWCLTRWRLHSAPGWAWATGLAVLLQWLFAMYFGLILVLILGAVALADVLRAPTVATLRSHWPIARAVTVALLPLVPALATFHRVQSELGYERSVAEVARVWATSGRALVCSKSSEWFTSLLHCQDQDTNLKHYALWPGAVLVIAVGVSVVAALGWLAAELRRPDTRSRGVIVLGLLATGLATHDHTVLLAAPAVALAFEPRLTAFRVPASVLWLALAGLLLAVAFGPAPRWASWAPAWSGPFAAFHDWIPGFASLRMCYRFLVPGLVVAAAAFGALARTRPAWARTSAAAVLGLVWFTDFQPNPLPRSHVPRDEVVAVAEWLRNAPLPGAVLELPVRGFDGGDDEDEVRAMLAQRIHHRPIVNGHSGFEPPLQAIVHAELESFPSARSVALLQALGVGYVAIYPDRMNTSGKDRLGRVVDAPGLHLEATLGGRFVYSVAPGPGLFVPEVADLVPVPLAAATSNVGSGAPGVIYALPGAQFSTDINQAPDQWLELEVSDAPVTVAAVQFANPVLLDYARGIAVEVSVDHARWDRVHTAPMLFGPPTLHRRAAGAVHVLRFDPVPARYVRLVLTESASRWWRVARAQVLAVR